MTHTDHETLRDDCAASGIDAAKKQEAGPHNPLDQAAAPDDGTISASDYCDRELIEKAARAAGITGHWWPEFNCIQKTNGELFAPLAYDADALRLAKALGLTVDFNFGRVCHPNGGILAVGDVDIRRTIVRAAAAMEARKAGAA
jgi:hypothetical protein